MKLDQKSLLLTCPLPKNTQAIPHCPRNPSHLSSASSLTGDGDFKGITAIDVNRKSYEIGLPIIQKAGVEHKINFIESQALPVLEKLLENQENVGSFDFAFVDADKGNYLNYHERIMKLVKVGGMIIYDDTLWGGAVALPEESIPVAKRDNRQNTIEFNKSLVADPRIDICLAPLGNGVTICRRIL